MVRKGIEELAGALEEESEEWEKIERMLYKRRLRNILPRPTNELSENPIA